MNNNNRKKTLVSFGVIWKWSLSLHTVISTRALYSPISCIRKIALQHEIRSTAENPYVCKSFMQWYKYYFCCSMDRLSDLDIVWSAVCHACYFLLSINYLRFFDLCNMHTSNSSESHSMRLWSVIQVIVLILYSLLWQVHKLSVTASRCRTVEWSLRM